ncbi:PHD finger protein MALE MEIOCYTE DEATH 1 [Acorus gramineus]|uniref:PHD finger protein MALE MEIOCYTE DEATH 1 n=1 Tax=Acorus gramineus TaxID=55184 RepID=A0AAV9BLL8_ACOGR|nr:PHD finger protein MALE MEIOCYTE DEATH 1 [Acorus gramineus]
MNRASIDARSAMLRSRDLAMLTSRDVEMSDYPFAAATTTINGFDWNNRRSKAFGFHSFSDPGSPKGFRGAFRDNVRSFIRECCAVEGYVVEGMPVWCTLLVDEGTGVVIPLYTVEESVGFSPDPLCIHCRCSGWSHHFVSKRRYHFIIPVCLDWGKHLQPPLFDVQDRVLHGLIHCNGFGHLLCINGREGSGSTHITGRDIMDLWDRLCTALRTRAVSVDDWSSKKSMQLRLLLGVAYKQTWFGQWGYKFCQGSFGVTEHKYYKSIELLSLLDLNNVIEDFRRAGRDREIRHIVNYYQSLSGTPLASVCDLLRFMLELAPRVRSKNVNGVENVPPPKRSPVVAEDRNTKMKKRVRELSEAIVEMGNRWPARRLRFAATVIVDALREHGKQGGMTRQEVRDAARLHIGDTGLLDFVIKSIGNVIVDGSLVIRAPNPTTKVLEFKIQDAVSKGGGGGVASESDEDKALSLELPMAVALSGRQVYRDLGWLYKHVLSTYPGENTLLRAAGRAALNGKRWVKEWVMSDDKDDDLLRFTVGLEIPDEEAAVLTQQSPPAEMVVVPLHATIGEVVREAERALRDTYFVFKGFEADWGLEGVDGGADEVVFGAVESGSTVWLKGRGVDVSDEGRALRYEGGVDDWVVDCGCGAKDDDGERMAACDLCGVWQHTCCAGIDDNTRVPRLFVCSRCNPSSLF